MCCGGPEKTDVIVINGHVPMQLKEDTYTCCSGPEKTDVVGIHVHVPMQLEEAI